MKILILTLVAMALSTGGLVFADEPVSGSGSPQSGMAQPAAQKAVKKNSRKMKKNRKHRSKKAAAQASPSGESK